LEAPVQFSIKSAKPIFTQSADYVPTVPQELDRAAESRYFGQYALKNWYLYSVYNITPNLQFATEYTKNYADYAKAGGVKRF
jgi:hypothetical protein